MPGSLRARPDRGADAWELRVFVGRDGAGRVRHQSRLFRGTKRAAQRELARLVFAQDASPEVVPDDIARQWGPATTFNDAIAGWRENGWDDLSPLTVTRYEGVWRLHIRDDFGRRRISTTGPYDVEKFFRKLKAQGAGQETVRYVRALLHRACRLARKWSGNTLPNPIADTELPKWGQDESRGPVRAPQVAEVLAILSAADQLDLPRRCGLRVLAATGMRRGEACGLRWDDVDWSARTLRVDEAVISIHGAVATKPPKTSASIRCVAIDLGTLELLSELSRVQSALAATCEMALGPRSFLLSLEPGGTTPMHPDTLSKAFAKARQIAGVPADVRLHSLRHFQATALDSVIPERQKQARLGWSTVRMARHYTDAVPEDDVRAAEHIGQLLAGGSVTS